jgi:hypothetical protein
MLDAVTMLGRRDSMERTGKIKFYYDPEGDYMQVTFQKKAGYFCETEDDRVMEKVDAEGNVLGAGKVRCGDSQNFRTASCSVLPARARRGASAGGGRTARA